MFFSLKLVNLNNYAKNINYLNYLSRKLSGLCPAAPG